MRRAPVATGLSHGRRQPARHPAAAVAQALQRAGLAQANGVLLFLTPDYAPQATEAVRAAARAARCTQVVGCTASGLITESEWVLDSPGAAAMVFGGDLGLAPPRPRHYHGEAVLSFCTPRGIHAEWLDQPLHRLGAVASDVVEQGQFLVWQGARVAEGGCAQAQLDGARHAAGVSQGIQALTAPIEVAEVAGYEVLRMGSYPALNVLVQSLPTDVVSVDQIPLHLLIGGVTYGDPDNAIAEGRYRLNHIIAADPGSRSITLAQPLHAGERLFWGMRDALAAERDMQRAIRQARRALGRPPDFGCLFPCVGRGPSFYGNRDRDVDLLRQAFPDMPFIGFYGNGEIGPLQGDNHLYQYSSVLGLFAAG